MSITRLQQARQMYAQGQRVGGIMGSNAGSMLVTPTRDGSRPGYYGPDAGHENDPGHGSNSDNGGGDGPPGGGDKDMTYTAPTAPPAKPKSETPTPPTFNIHGGPTYKAPPQVPDLIGPINTTVPNVTYNTGLEIQRLKNIQLQNQLRDATYQPLNIPAWVPGSTLIKTLGSFGFNTNKDFFEKNVAGKYGYGYGLKDFEKYMGDRASGKAGAYGNENMGQNAINASSGGDDGIMDVYNAPNYTDDGDADGDGDVDQDDFIFRYFDKTGETLQSGAGGVEDLMTQIRQRISNIFS